MNPRHRRLLIPGLLVALMIVVLISSLARRADGAPEDTEVVSTIADARITESSGLAISRQYDDLAYTVNDSGHQAVIFAVRISTGEVLGTTTLNNELVDAEALALDADGTVWIADTGDNRTSRTDASLYALPEPGPATTSDVTATRYRLGYPDGPRDIEALAISPTTGAKLLLTKGLFSGESYQLTGPLSSRQGNQVTAISGDIPGLVTDASFTPDGRYVIARTYVKAVVLDASTWQEVDSRLLPPTTQGETLAVERSGRSYLIGSEGANSPLIRVPFPGPAASSEATTPDPTTQPGGGPSAPTQSSDADSGFAGATWVWAVGVVGLLAVIAAAATRRT